jgi:hypothetical protein
MWQVCFGSHWRQRILQAVDVGQHRFGISGGEVEKVGDSLMESVIVV